MVTVVGTASGWYYEGIQASQTDRTLNEAEDAKRESEEKRQQAQTLADSLKRTLYAADMNSAMTAWEKNDLRLVKELLGKYSLRTQRGWEWHYLSSLYQQAKPKSLIATNISPLRVFQVPGSTRVITTHSDGNVLTLYNPDLRDPLEMQVGNLEEGTWNYSYADLSPDGSLLVHPSDDFSSVILRNTSSMIVVDEIPVPHELANSAAQITTASFSPTGQQIAICIKKVGVAIYDLSSKDFGRLIELPGIGDCEAIEFTTDGSHIAVTSDPVTVVGNK